MPNVVSKSNVTGALVGMNSVEGQKFRFRVGSAGVRGGGLA